MTRSATAVWSGTGKEGGGTLSLESGILTDQKYNWAQRFADEPGTNPEELVAAAHAGCFSMKLSFVLGEAGFTADSINTKAEAIFRDGMIAEMHLTCTASVPGMNAEQFAEAAASAKENCPISKSLRSEITLDASLAE